jgi:uncharacterized membrane protein
MAGLVLIGIYVAIAAAGELVAIGIGLIVDRINEMMSLLAFFVSSAMFLAAGWPIALRVSARFSEDA